jgi:dTDP-4-amino-4,6-dideoxygalactose transaminase
MATVNPYTIVDTFEKAVAEYCGAPYGVAVESCTAAIFLSLMRLKELKGRRGIKTITIPSRTYPSVPCSIIHAGGKVRFYKDKEKNNNWKGEYCLYPYVNITDAALRFKKGMFKHGFQCLSFHIKKLLPIGRGGMILCDRETDYEWFKKARFDGRNPVPLQDDKFTMLGWNCYMQPSDAARGLQLLQALGDRELEDLKVEDQKYPDLSKFKIYRQ